MSTRNEDDLCAAASELAGLALEAASTLEGNYFNQLPVDLREAAGKVMQALLEVGYAPPRMRQ
jgi:hypothetical protein